MSRLENDLQKWNRARNKALRTLDMRWARREALPDKPPNDVLLAALHKARYQCPAIEVELRMESGRWLLAHGMQGIDGAIPPDGGLPQ